ncbi:ribosome biogenesis protein BMS1 homolog [Papaver somniferum]|uniref:ribosome biogenesis protein BMS1 homolog n=1 Tax=Papaver somniferum TaxID=3469 RepID=UPI000E6F8739|nr:ribosome biogenesis protein BMS1 homolog [Papaver somniferum]
MAFGAAASSSSSNQEYVLCGTDYLKIYKTTTADNSPEVSAAGLQSDEHKDTSASIDLRVEEEEERSPYVIVVQGPRKVGKSTLIRSLADHYADANRKLVLVCMRDSVTIITGKRRRIQFVECPNNVNGMRNAAKYADAVILLMNAYVGFEMGTFEFVNVLILPKVIGVLTSLDMFGNNFAKRIRIETCLIQHFRIEVCKEARLFCLSGLDHGMYKKSEILDLANFISAMDFHPLSWKAAQPYLLAEHFEDTAAIDLTVKEEEPPYVIVVHGPPEVGKSLLIRSLVEHYTKGNLNNVLYMQGPVTIVSGEQRRIQFVECPNSLNGMLDAAKYADAVILLIDTSIGFEMETFEFVNILRVHGMPKVIGVLISRGVCTNIGNLVRTKKYIMNRFCTEIYQGATLFCLSGLENGKYPKHEILDLASFLSVMEFHPLSWRVAQPYVLVDRYEDATLPERVVMDNRCDRDIVLYGYLRGSDIEQGTKVHIAGMGDLKRRSLKGKEEDEYPGFRPGTYLRLEVRDVPFEMVENIDPNHPILVGGISSVEENVGYMQATLKHRKLLKTRNPIIVSIGWRQYQTIPVYATEDHRSKWPRMLNYTPVDTQCLAMFWGPLASPNTGIVAVQYLRDKKAAFRILATAVVVDYDIGKIIKKCKRSRTPWKISGKTALIKDLFKSDDEFYRFKDAILWTESGIPGKVVQAAERIAECKFKRRIVMGDTVFMRVQKEVEVPRFFNPVVPMPGLSDGPEEFRKVRRMVAFVEKQPSFRDLTIAKKFELDHCNKVEQKEFKKHPMLVIYVDT